MTPQIQSKELVGFLNNSETYLKNFNKERSQLTLALSKLNNKYKKFYEKYHEEANQKKSDLEAEFCAKDKDGNFIEDNVVVGGQVIFRKKFNKDQDKKFRDSFDAYDNDHGNEFVDFEPHFVPVPANLHISWVQAFTGFVFKEMTDEELEKWYLQQGEVKKEENK